MLFSDVEMQQAIAEAAAYILETPTLFTSEYLESKKATTFGSFLLGSCLTLKSI